MNGSYLRLMQIIVEGWRFIPQSYAIVNQFQLLEMLKLPDLEVFHWDAPYVDEHWYAIAGLLDEKSEAALQAIQSPTSNLVADVTLRMYFPFNLKPSTTPFTYCFGTAEWGIVDEYKLKRMGVSSFREAWEVSDSILITPSEWSKAGFIRSGADAERIFVVPHGVDTSIYKPISEAERQALRQELGWDDFIFLNVSSAGTHKGTDILLKALAVLLEREPDVRLVLKGEEFIYASESKIMESMNELTFDEIERVLSRLTYIGDTVSFAELARYYQAADAYVSPYCAEGFNLPALEALACGLPVICTKGGPTDIFTNSTFSWQIESTFQEGRSPNGHPMFRLAPDLDHLVFLMETAIDSPSFLAKARQLSPRFVAENFTWKHAVDQLLKVVKLS